MTLYALYDLMNDGTAIKVGSFDFLIWPVGGLFEPGKNPCYAFDSEDVRAGTKSASRSAGGDSLLNAMLKLLPGDSTGETETDVEAEPTAAPEKRKTSAYVPESYIAVGYEDILEMNSGITSVRVTAQTENGNPADSTNGLCEIAWDPAMFAFDGITSPADYLSYTVDEEEGLLRFGYVELGGIAAGRAVATVYLRRLVNENAAVTVRQLELGPDHADYRPESLLSPKLMEGFANGIPIIRPPEGYKAPVIVDKRPTTPVRNTIPKRKAATSGSNLKAD